MIYWSIIWLVKCKYQIVYVLCCIVLYWRLFYLSIDTFYSHCHIHGASVYTLLALIYQMHFQPSDHTNCFIMLYNRLDHNIMPDISGIFWRWKNGIDDIIFLTNVVLTKMARFVISNNRCHINHCVYIRKQRHIVTNGLQFITRASLNGRCQYIES